VVIKIFFFWENRAIRSILEKNLIAHRPRNQKTAIMYALSLGFIIFAAIAADVQITTIMYAKQHDHGAYMDLRNTYPAISETALPISLREVATELETFLSKLEIVQDWTWISETLWRVLPNVQSTIATHKGNLFTHRGIDIHAISPNFFDVTIPGFLNVDECDYPDSELARALYSADGFGKALVPSLWKQQLGLKVGSEFLVGITVSRGKMSNQMEATQVDSTSYRYYRTLSVLGFLDSTPAFKVSPFPLVGGQAVLVSFPTYVNLTGGFIQSVSSVPLNRLLLKIPPKLPKPTRDDLRVRLEETSLGIGRIWDYERDIEPLVIPTTILKYIFSLTTLIAMFICFFSLTSSMFTNVYEQVKEIGVLRALGVTTGRMKRVYVYEAFVLVLTSSVLGIMIGMAIGYAMTMQQSLFTQLPLPFVFPWLVMITVFVGSVLFAVIASWAPISHIMGMQIVHIFRYI